MKFLYWNCRGLGNCAKLSEFKQLLFANNPDLIFLSETKMSANDFRKVQNKCRLQNGLVVDLVGRNGGLALMWRDGMDVSIQSYSKHHIDSMVNLENNKKMRGRGLGKGGLGGWGRFYAILNDAEKEGGCRGVRAHMNDLKKVMDELALVDIKPDSGCGEANQSDHDAILLDLWGRKPKDFSNDPRMCFKFELCWASDREAENIIGDAWNRGDTKYGDKLDRVRSILGPWQRKKYGRLKSEIKGDSVKTLKGTRKRLDFLYAREESYWAQRSQSKWLREGDRNTRYFHAKATGRLKKNIIEKLKDMEGN
ncbi:hypothetical protein V6Z11_A11G246800 [Gossypium hirsutum]